jgi:AcrR family transcriptional regulator
MARRKTRDLIIETSLLLFNRDGEPNVTTVDIANELDISPGNLYYHFKGKEELVAELFARFHAQFVVILREPVNDGLRLEDYGYYLVVLFEHIHTYRFLYRNISLIQQRYSQIERPFRRLLQLQLDTARFICAQLAEARIIEADDARLALMARNIALTLTYWFEFDSLISDTKSTGRKLIGEGVLQVFSLIAPYMGERQQAFMDVALALHAGNTQDTL